jgi:hypothetical protein
MTKNREVFTHDPLQTPLVNNGQARIADAADERTWAELRAELSSFVCEGQYEDGLVRIITSFLKNLEKGTNQPAAWVSGFFGSGKSHLLKMLVHLWVNTVFPDGRTARDLLPTLPDDLKAALRELDQAAKRHNLKVHAAAGTLPAGTAEQVRSTILAIVLRSTGLPESVTQAKFCLWLHHEGIYTKVKGEIEKAGKDFRKELSNLYVSKAIAAALLKHDPKLGKDEREVRETLKHNFPLQTTDLTTTEFVSLAKDALMIVGDGHIPLTVLALDEVQQYIGSDHDRSVLVTDVAEAVSKEFDDRIMLVGSGQNSLTGTKHLTKLRDRFTVPVELHDNDVDAVLRKVLLEKKPSHRKEVQEAIDVSAGEISRHLSGSKIQERTEDRNTIVDDYPLLPVRRRFWEAALRAVDEQGTQGQLRTQLRIVHDALAQIAEKNVGTVVPASFMFEQLQPVLVQTGVLLRELDDRIRSLKDGTPAGQLAAELCGLIFMIRKMQDAKMELGIRTDAMTLADLLVADLANDGPRLRGEVPKLLEKLTEDGLIQDLGGEYTLQTREGAEWDRDFKARRKRIEGAVEMADHRDRLLRETVAKALQSVRLTQGASKEPRSVVPYIGAQKPPVDGATIPVWVRDEWNCSKGEHEREARAVGTKSPLIFVFLSKANFADELARAIAGAKAAEEVLNFHGTPSTEPGRVARDSIMARKQSAEADLEGILKAILSNARVWVGGGQEKLETEFTARVKAAAEAAVDRLYPRFGEADSADWPKVIQRAKNGDESALQSVGWNGPLDQHPVCREVLNTAGNGTPGRDIRSTLRGGQLGWPQDAIDAAIILLHRTGHLSGKSNHNPVPPGALDQAKISVTEFRRETTTISPADRLAIRGLARDILGRTVNPDEMETAPRGALQKLRELAAKAGGPAPCPNAPSTLALDDLAAKSGNEFLLAFLAAKPTLEQFAKEWTELAKRAEARLPVWQAMERLAAHAQDLASAAEPLRQMHAVRNDRSLLESSDPLPSIKGALTTALRDALGVAHCETTDAYALEHSRLTQNDTWQNVPDSDQIAILRSVDVQPIVKLDVASEEGLLRQLDATPLHTWPNRRDAIAQRVNRALQEAAKRLEPKVQPVRLRSTTLKSAGDIDAWLTEQKQVLLAKLKAGPVLVE